MGTTALGHETPYKCVSILKIKRLFTETAMGTSMNEDIGSVTEKYFRAIKKIASAIVPRLCGILLFLDTSYSLSKNYQIEKDALKDLHAFTDAIIKERKLFLKKNPEILNVDSEEHETSKKGRLAMLDLLIQNQDEGFIDDNGIREEVDTFMFRVTSKTCYLNF